ncbi:MAG TPA: phosphoglycerate dehydrogenase [Anaerolineales bacterium]|nr:phosphoglycerate dehydrogenase [Anaerolineales bacterium]
MADASFHILVSDHLGLNGWEILRESEDVTMAGPLPERKALLAEVPRAHALLLRSQTQADAELIACGKRLRVIARAGAQLENVDIDAATRHGIMVINVPDANVIAVAEHTMAMLLALARHIPRGYTSLRAGRWERHEILGFQLRDKTIGVIGYGRHGHEVANRAQAFGMDVLAYDPYTDIAHARAHGVSIVPLHELLARADVISLHTSLTDETRNFINGDTIAQMKIGVHIINCSRAELIDEKALLHALNADKVAGAALDTLCQEPAPPDHPLVQHPNVLAVPHLNQNTVESQNDTSRMVVEQTLDALRDADYRSVVNLPFGPGAEYALHRPYLRLAEQLGKLQAQLADGRIKRIEVELQGEGLRNIVRPVAAAMLKGMLPQLDERPVNYVNAPLIAHERGIETAQVVGLELVDYPNLLSCRVHWEDGGSQTVAGVLFAGAEARLVQYRDIQVDARPEGTLLFLENHDVPGVIGKVGTYLGAQGINIGEWRYGRDRRGGRAISFINLDSECPADVVHALHALPEVFSARAINL